MSPAHALIHSLSRALSFTHTLTISLLCLQNLAVYHMKETGWVKVSQTDVGPLHYEYKDEKEKQSST